MSVSAVKMIINGQKYTLTYNDTSGKYAATVTACGRQQKQPAWRIILILQAGWESDVYPLKRLRKWQIIEPIIRFLR